jgi:hypothetical protein
VDVDCQAVSFWNRNSIIVGSLTDGNTLSPFSSFRDGVFGTSEDEAPHIVAKGDNIVLPWFTGTQFLQGTSFAAPTISAMVANLISYQNNLERNPEVIRAILMGSANKKSAWGGDPGKWPSNSSLDFKAGAGLPDGDLAKQFADNLLEDATTSGSVNNVVNDPSVFRFVFLPTDADGATITRTVTSSSTYLEVWVTWIGDPRNHTLGRSAYDPDDIDLTVTVPSQSLQLNSFSAFNSTEQVSAGFASPVSYTITITLRSRESNPTSNIFGACAIRPFP